MRFKSPSALAFAAALLALPLPIFAQAGEAQSGQYLQNASTPSSATQEAARMVSADAVFTSDIDSRKMQPGAQFQAKLLKKVQLEGGPELPTATVLVGQVVDDNTQSGAAKLALRFTEADLKNGQTVPIRATIVYVYSVNDSLPASEDGGLSEPESWDHKTMAIDQLSAVSGVDLHSNIASPNSGVFVSTRKDDIKLSKSIGVELAIAPRGGSNQQNEGGN